MDWEDVTDAELEARDAELDPPPRVCSNRIPEPHDLGEFPMTCYTCHMFADS